MRGTGIGRKRILIVDDEPSICAFCERVLAKQGYEVHCASNGKIALSLISKMDYQLYLFDIKMPIMDGKELFESLQQTHPDLIGRIVFIAGSAMDHDLKSFLQRSGRPVLLKPFSAEELKVVAGEALKVQKNE